MTEKENLHVRHAVFRALIEEYKLMGMNDKNILSHLCMFLGKYAFDHADGHRKTIELINEGIQIGRQWSMDCFEMSEFD